METAIAGVLFMIMLNVVWYWGYTIGKEKFEILKKTVEEVVQKMDAQFPQVTYVGNKYTIKDVQDTLRSAIGVKEVKDVNGI